MPHHSNLLLQLILLSNLPVHIMWLLSPAETDTKIKDLKIVIEESPLTIG